MGIEKTITTKYTCDKCGLQESVQENSPFHLSSGWIVIDTKEEKTVFCSVKCFHIYYGLAYRKA